MTKHVTVLYAFSRPPVFGQLPDRRHRFTILKRGRFGVGKLWTYAVGGERIDPEIAPATLPPDDEPDPKVQRAAGPQAVAEHSKNEGAGTKRVEQ